MDDRAQFERMVRSVGRAFYERFIDEVRIAVRNGNLQLVVEKARAEWTPPIVTAEFRIRRMAGAVRNRYDFDP